MLLELSIADFAIIEQTSLRFSDGLNALTGETGAGKSILLDALGAVLGARVSSDLVRTGRQSARVEAAFALDEATLARLRPVTEDLGIDIQADDAVVLSRDILASGRSTARINGRLTTAGALADVGSILVDIHGQSDHLAILKATEQLNLLDRFAQVGDLRTEFGERIRHWRVLRRRISDITQGERERAQRIDLLRYQVDEIDSASLSEGEDESALREREVLRHADRLQNDARQAFARLLGDEVDDQAALGALREVSSLVLDMTSMDAEVGGLAERANDLLLLGEDLARDLRDYAEALEADEGRLLEIEDRLDLITGLKRKYGATVADVLSYRDDIARELDELGSSRYDAAALAEEIAGVERDISHLGMKLSRRRTNAAAELGRAIESAIADLRMGRAHVAIRVGQRDDPNGVPLDGTDRTVHVDETGLDQVEYMIAPNAGEALKPLARIASGGETARLMLAIKSILSLVDLTPTLVFDEIDVGVGGRSGQVVGEKLHAIAREHQVIVVTHLPQIAAFAESHLRIEKSERDGRTVSTVRELNESERETELAAMLDGVPISPAAIANAREMLARTRRATAI